MDASGEENHDWDSFGSLEDSLQDSDYKSHSSPISIGSLTLASDTSQESNASSVPPKGHLRQTSAPRYIWEPNWVRHDAIRYLPFWAKTEVARLFQNALKRGVANAAIEEVLRKSAPDEDFRETWLKMKKAYTRLCGDILEVEDLHRRTIKRVQALDSQDDISQWSASLKYDAESEFGKLNFQLKALGMVEKSNEYTRRYGSDRFLIIDLIRPESFHREKSATAIKKFRTKGLSLLGREWKQFSCRDVKHREDQEPEYSLEPCRLILFAIHGEEENFKPVSISQLVSSHIDLELPMNREQTCTKLFTRIGLGLSKTDVTIELKPEELSAPRRDISHYHRDRKEFILMTDGSGTGTRAIFHEIAKKLGVNHEIFAVQMRMGGFKGIIVRDPNEAPDSIEREVVFRKSQQKFETDNKKPEHYQINVLKALGTEELNSSRLNEEFLRIASNNGVPNEVLGKLLEEAFEGISERLLKPLKEKDGEELEKWLRKRISSSDTMLEVDDNKDWRFEEEALLLVNLGTDPWICGHLRGLLQKIYDREVTEFLRKHRIPLKKSTRVRCQPDYTRKLKPGEVYLEFATPFKTSDNCPGMKRLDGEVLITRNPAYLPSDMQKVKAVDCESLHGYPNIIYFPVLGTQSLAATLAGGDHDGDEIFVCWEERLVSPFISQHESTFDVPIDDYIYCPKNQRTVDDLLRRHRGNVAAATDEFIDIGVGAALKNNWVGMANTLYKQLEYTYGLEAPETVIAAKVTAALMDSPKTGNTLTSKWFEFQEKMRGKVKKIAYLSDDNITHDEPKHVMDFLHFTTGPELKKQFSDELASLFPEEALDSSMITKTYQGFLNGHSEALSRISSSGEGIQFKWTVKPGCPEKLELADQKSKSKMLLLPENDQWIIRSALNGINQVNDLKWQLCQLIARWKRYFWDNLPRGKQTSLSKKNITEFKRKCKRDYDEIPPDPKYGLAASWVTPPENLNSEWAKLKASVLFHSIDTWPNQGEKSYLLAWTVAPDTLRIMLADSIGKAWTPVRIQKSLTARIPKPRNPRVVETETEIESETDADSDTEDDYEQSTCEDSFKFNISFTDSLNDSS